MLFLLGDLLRENVNQPEDGDADNWRDDQHHPGHHVGHGVERLPLEHRGLGRGGVKHGGQEQQAQVFPSRRRSRETARSMLFECGMVMVHGE